MFKKIQIWLANKEIIKLRIIKDDNKKYCPICLSDIDESKEVLICPECNVKIFSR